MVVNQLLKYGEFGIVLFDNFQVTERTRNQFVPKAHEGSNPSLCAKAKSLEITRNPSVFKAFLRVRLILIYPYLSVFIRFAISQKLVKTFIRNNRERRKQSNKHDVRSLDFVQKSDE